MAEIEVPEKRYIVVDNKGKNMTEPYTSRLLGAVRCAWALMSVMEKHYSVLDITDENNKVEVYNTVVDYQKIKTFLLRDGKYYGTYLRLPADKVMPSFEAFHEAFQKNENKDWMLLSSEASVLANRFDVLLADIPTDEVSFYERG
jgi:predicted  nucleic acid-binding Zn ribbon protein